MFYGILVMDNHPLEERMKSFGTAKPKMVLVYLYHMIHFLLFRHVLLRQDPWY
jgi:hypothetical protein